MKLNTLKQLIPLVTHKSFLKLLFLFVVLMVVLKNLKSPEHQTIVKQTILPIAMKIYATNYTPQIKVSGFLNPENTCVTRVNFKAVVNKVLIKKGRAVKKGDIILELKSDEIEKRLFEAKARYAHKEAEHQAYHKLSAKSIVSQHDYLSIIADLEQARANLQKAETDADELKVKAWQDGHLEECYVHKGDTVFAQDKLVNIIYPEMTYVRSYVSEEIIEKLSIGMNVKVNIGNKEYQGKVYSVSKFADPITRSFYVDTIVDNLDSENYGSSAEITFMLPQKRGFFINASALTLDDEGVLGVKALKDNLVIFLPVQLNSITEHGAYIECGDGVELALITYGGEFLLPGQTPEIIWQKTPTL